MIVLGWTCIIKRDKLLLFNIFRSYNSKLLYVKVV